MITRILLAWLLVLLASSTDAQFRKIPSEVTESFKAKYPTANKVAWKDRLASFQAEFNLGEQFVKANFSSQGEWLRSEKNYAFDKLPAAVKEGFKKSKFADWSVKEVVETDDKEDGREYRITVRKGDMAKRYLRFAASGQLIDDNILF